MHKTILAAAIVSLGVIGLSGCDVKKTQEGSITPPQYEVTKKQDGDVTLPKYDVTTPDVNVGKKEVEVNVPKVTTEKETVTVPSVDIKTGEEKKAEQDAAKK